jgi:hypothetical protein
VRCEKDIDVVLEASAYHHCGRPGRGFLAAEPRYRGARDRRRLGSRAAADRADHNYARGRLAARTTLFYGFESAAPCGTTFCSTLWSGYHQLGPRFQLTNPSHPARGESFVSLLCSALAAIPHHCFFLSPKLERKRTADHATLSAALKTLAPRFPGRHLPLSLSLFLCPGIPTFRHSKA